MQVAGFETEWASLQTECPSDWESGAYSFLALAFIGSGAERACIANRCVYFYLVVLLYIPADSETKPLA